MKKLFLILSAMLLCIGCTTDTTTDIEVLPQSEREIYISLESSPLSRIELNEDCKTVWTESDQVSVFNKTNGNDLWRFRGDTGQRNGIFIEKKKGNSTATIDKVVVVYPYNENYTLAATDKSVLARLSAEQTYQKGSYGVGANLMVSQSDNNNFVLKSVCGWLKFQFVGTGVVSKIEFSGNDDEQVAGKITVNYSTYTMSLIEDGLGDAADDEVGGTLVSAEDYVTTVALNCVDGVALDTETVTDFYLVLPPQTFRKGITVKVTCTDGTVVEKSTTSPLTISRNTIQPMATLTINGKPTEPASNEIWYTATEKVVKNNWTVDTFGANITDHTFDTTTGKGIITFDGEVTEIGTQAFQSCRSLTSITIPDSVTEIGNNPFEFCKNLAEFNGKFASEDGRCLIVDGVLKSFAPAGITTYNIPDSVTEIGEDAFCYCESLTSVTIPDSVTEIGDNAFVDCDYIAEFKGKFAADNGRCLIVDGVLKSFAPSGLTQYTIPEGVTSIGDFAFYDCRSLTSVTIPDSVTEIGSHAFEFCHGLTSFTFPNSVTEIGDFSFQYCDGLTSVTIPKGVTRIGIEAFDGCSGLSSVIIPNSVTEIGNYAFHNCTGLTSITIPNSITTIENGTFSYCDGLTSITIPDSVTEIGNSAFRDCSSLTNITIPNSVTKIGYNAFRRCSNLTSVFCERTTPPTALIEYSPWDAFENNAADRKIYVPTESVDAYKAADGWSKYVDSIEPYDFSAVSE